METTKVVFTNHRSGEVQLFSGDNKIGKMDIAITGGNVTVYHTEVEPEYEGHGFAKILLNKLVSYAKENGMKIIPLCPYVNLQFRHHPEVYADIWFKVEAS
ncbi:GNAT family N-acetyltransferase [Mucilaginibacter pedocola]|uniref:Acetyltransferase n=1 Tax=Mucilaginibacter pedocola TaxID=1792845 RepID=A0A1S9PD37_9SPHI|nr:GNAT family N-acetyltransferase [Mucilaginibacter pedocola]OOQ58894.1 acetyltransferase [Mucilaginibacter pedocola]